MASHHRGGGRAGGGGRGQANPNVAQGGRGYGGGGGRGGQYYGDDSGGRGGRGGGRGFEGRGGGYDGGRDGSGGRGVSGYQEGRAGGQGAGGYQGGRDRGGFQGTGGYQGSRDGGGGRGVGGYQEGRGGSWRPSDHRWHGYAFLQVTITPETMLKGVYRQVMSKLVSEKRQTELGGRLPAYDGRKSLFTAGELPFKTKEFEVTLSGRTERRYKVLIKHATMVSLQQLTMLLAGYPTDIPAQALQVLDIVLRDIVLTERNNMEYIAVGRSFFSPVINTVNLGLGVEGWKGFYQSIRPTQMGLSVIVDTSSTAFVRPMLLIDFVMEILNKNNPGTFRNINNMEYVKIKKALRGVRIEVTHRGNARQKYRIATLTQSRPSVLDFESSSGVRKTVTDYFREAYQLEIQYDFLPCLQVGTDQRPNYLPMEVCKIVPGQQYRKKLEGQQVAKLMDSTCQRPSAREDNIRQVVLSNDYNRTERANEFGIEVDYHPTSVHARVLRAPTLKYYGTGSESFIAPNDGQWNMIKRQVVDGAKVSNWACINFCHDLHKDAVKKFCAELVKCSRNTGVHMDDLKFPIFSARPHQVEGDLKKCCQDARNNLKVNKIDLLLAILPEKNGSLYGDIKRICETQIGIMSQCCLGKHVTSARTQYFANVAIKINAKAGGRNSEFANPQESLPVVWSEPTIIFGADVTHPAALDDTAPSIASVVASQDSKVAKYNGIVRAQVHRKELIDGLEDIVKELLRAFEEGCKRRPMRLIFYRLASFSCSLLIIMPWQLTISSTPHPSFTLRDGVSEGQFKQVLEQEIPEIEKAWKALYNEKPRVTFIVVQKRHHTRLFPDNHNDRRWMDRSGNILAGTVIDKNICHPTEFDFFLCSHSGTKGTSRPTHYHVLRDDNKFTADGLQSLTYNLCYMYASCTRSVSIAPPAYYAHKLAFRARFYVNQGSDAATLVSSGSSSAPAAGPTPLPQIRDELKRSMFYC
ncbi:Protein argonaute 18 [Dichanthelium oligosanthes]|uniref:Protein argonaute 18 n=1 Tax=Dichanthelium oligosanthes TaxID=888268 RepID=A0A1E5WBC0_9POAL|nr:Protein argonaute 18 [Dichanthelium oligosanthes]